MSCSHNPLTSFIPPSPYPPLSLCVQAVRLKEKQLASEVIAVSCGPQACQVRISLIYVVKLANIETKHSVLYGEVQSV